MPFQTFLSSPSNIAPVQVPRLMQPQPMQPLQMNTPSMSSLSANNLYLQQLRAQKLQQDMALREHGTGKAQQEWLKTQNRNQVLLAIQNDPELRKAYNDIASKSALYRKDHLPELKNNYIAPILKKYIDTDLSPQQVFDYFFGRELKKAQLEHEERMSDASSATLPNFKKGTYDLYSTIKSKLPWVDAEQVVKDNEAFAKEQDKQTKFAQYQQELARDGYGIIDRSGSLFSAGMLANLAENIPGALPYLATAPIGGLTGMAVRAGIAAAQGDYGYTKQVYTDPNLTKEQKEQAMNNTSARLGNAAVSGALGAVAPNVAKPMQFIPGLRTAGNLLTKSGAVGRTANSALSLGTLSGGQQVAGNAFYQSATNPYKPPELQQHSWTAGVKDAIISGALTGGALHMGGQGAGAVGRRVLNRFSKPAQPAPAQPTTAQPTPTQPAPAQPAPAQPAPVLSPAQARVRENNFVRAAKNPLTVAELNKLPRHYRENLAAARNHQDLPYPELGLWDAEQAAINRQRALALQNNTANMSTEELANYNAALNNEPLPYLSPKSIHEPIMPSKYADNKLAADLGLKLPYAKLAPTPPAHIQVNFIEASTAKLTPDQVAALPKEYQANHKAAMAGDELPYPKAGLWSPVTRDNNFQIAVELRNTLDLSSWPKEYFTNINDAANYRPLTYPSRGLYSKTQLDANYNKALQADLNTYRSWPKKIKQNFDDAINYRPLTHPDQEIIYAQPTVSPANTQGATPAPNGNNSSNSGMAPNTTGAAQPVPTPTPPTNPAPSGANTGPGSSGQPTSQLGANASNTPNAPQQGSSPQPTPAGSTGNPGQTNTTAPTSPGGNTPAPNGSPNTQPAPTTPSPGQRTFLTLKTYKAAVSNPDLPPMTGTETVQGFFMDLASKTTPEQINTLFPASKYLDNKNSALLRRSEVISKYGVTGTRSHEDKVALIRDGILVKSFLDHLPNKKNLLQAYKEDPLLQPLHTVGNKMIADFNTHLSEGEALLSDADVRAFLDAHTLDAQADLSKTFTAKELRDLTRALIEPKTELNEHLDPMCP